MSKRTEVQHSYLVLEQNGREIPIDLEHFNEKSVENLSPDLIKMIKFEILGIKPGKEPPSIHLMQEKELIGYEAASDSGHFRFWPKGTLMLKLLEDWAEMIAQRFGAMQIETPILYDWNHPAIRSQAESFHERHYMVHVPYHPEKEFVLRFAGDFGLFCMLSETVVSHHQLPLRIYEYSKSFRYEQRGELVGLRRLRGFSMPDIHCFCADIDQSWQEYQTLYRSYSDLATATGVEYAIIFRMVKKFYQKYKGHVLEMLQYSNRPAVIDVLSGMKHYWAVKHEFQGIDSVGGVCQVATVQLDVEDAERYGITYTKADGNKQGCVICHSSIGALERWIFLLIEAAAKMKVPQFPLWINPSQVRLIPVSDQLIEYSVNLAKQLHDLNIRIEVDDRSESVGKRIRLAGKDWVPYTLVIGQNEKDSNVLAVNKRGVEQLQNMTVEQLAEEIHGQCANMPFRHSTLPMLMSKRPIFFG